MFESDNILLDKWVNEERERRIAEKESKELKTGPIYTSSKAKREIEGLKTFGHVKETLDVNKLHKNVINPQMGKMLPKD